MTPSRRGGGQCGLVFLSPGDNEELSQKGYVYIFKDHKVLLWLTFAQTYELTSRFWKSHPTLKFLYQKNVQNYTSPCSNFFYFAEIQKNDWDTAKKLGFLSKNCSLCVFFIKISKLTLHEISLFFLNSSLLEILRFFCLQKFVVKPILTPFSSNV